MLSYLLLLRNRNTLSNLLPVSATHPLLEHQVVQRSPLAVPRLVHGQHVHAAVPYEHHSRQVVEPVSLVAARQRRDEIVQVPYGTGRHGPPGGEVGIQVFPAGTSRMAAWIEEKRRALGAVPYYFLKEKV